MKEKLCDCRGWKICCWIILVGIFDECNFIYETFFRSIWVLSLSTANEIIVMKSKYFDILSSSFNKIWFISINFTKLIYGELCCTTKPTSSGLHCWVFFPFKQIFAFSIPRALKNLISFFIKPNLPEWIKI